MRRYFSPWIALVVGLVLTIVASLEVKKAIERDAADEFAFTGDQVTLKVQERLDAYALILKGGAGLFAGSSAVDRREWQAYVEKLHAQDSVPGVQGIGFSQVIAPHQLAAHVARIRAEGFPDYSVRPAGARAVYTSIIFLEPFRDRNLRAFGFDMFSESVRRAAMERARDSGSPALSGKVELVQETGTEVQAGTLMYVPVYRQGSPTDTVEQRRAALIGWSYSPYRMKDLLEGILASWDVHKTKRVHLQIYDGLEVKADNLLYDSHADTHKFNALFDQQRTIDFNGKHWLLAFHAGEDVDAISYASAWTTLTGGIALSSLLCGLLLALSRTQVRANEIADNLTKELRLSADLLRESEARLTSLLDETKIQLWVFDGTRYKFFNKQWYEFTGQNPSVGMTIEAWKSVVHPDDLPKATETWLKHWATKTEHDNLFRLRRRDGVYRDFFCHTLPVLDKNGVFQAFQGFNLDITERKQAEEALLQSEETFKKLFADSADPILLIDSTGVFVECNQAALTLLKMTREKFLGLTPARISPEIQPNGRRSAESAPEMIALAYRKGVHRFDWTCMDSEGREFIVEMSLMPIVIKGQTMLHATWRDISERKTHQNQLEHIAHYDKLTGLPNRVLLADRLHQAMAQALRRKTMLAVAFLDLDGFKAINDQFGHQAGDYLLTALSGSMKQALREGDTLARIGGDEFLAVLIDLSDVESSVPMLSRLLTAAAEVVYYEGSELHLSASLGVTFYPQAEPIDADQLMRQADQAMYQAKQGGKNRYCIFNTEQDRSVRGHHESLERIRQALEEREFVLYYQPKVNMRTGSVIGVEALIRWEHPERGLLPPATFLPLIADHPLAIDLGEWVMDTAMAQVETWKTGGLALPVSVNIDAIQLEQADFVDHLQRQLAAHPQVAAGDLELEVLETSALQDITHVSSVIMACHKFGVGFALDDFGTGYSSLTYLKRLPADLLKIDQSFVRDMLDDPDDLAILNGILGLASAFQRRSIAEGVETLEQGKILLQLGCQLAQGYVIAHPMPAEDLPVWLATWRAPSSWLNQAPIRRDDLPILFAWVEHRAWIIKVVRFIRGECDTAPLLQHEKCRVGQWLIAEAQLHQSDRFALEALIMPLHIQIHELASELIRLKLGGQSDAAIAKLSELHRLRDLLLAQFLGMLR